MKDITKDKVCIPGQNSSKCLVFKSTGVNKLEDVFHIEGSYFYGRLQEL